MKPEIKNLKKAASRILKAAKNKEKIIIYGDADLDGITSVVILKDTIKNIGGEIADIYFPNREKEGHGITQSALKYLKKHVPALLISLDCGIGNYEEIKTANEIGFEVIIVDHHEVIGEVPEASIVVDPKQKGDEYPFKDFANVGLAFKLSQVLLKKKMTEALKKDFLELVALATIADMVPRVDENKEMIAEGLASLESSWRPGIQASMNLKEIKELNLMEKISKINSFLNIRDVKDRMPAAYRLLTALTEKEAGKLVRRLFKKGIEKRAKIGEIAEEVRKRIFGKSADPIIFEGDSDWELPLLGVVASILVKECKKPVFLYKKQKVESQGSIRASSEFNLVKALEKCSENLSTYGGHPKAAGFRVKNEYLEDFEKCLFKHFK